jgi:cytochrome c oxidase accessory protein FixG
MTASGFLDVSDGGRSVVRPDIPHAVKGRFRSIKSILATFLLTLYFVTPWVRWNRGPHLPDQAVMVDLPGRRLFVFGLEFWPRDLPIAVGIMVFSALALFYATSVAGRVWCGFACPQTVWSDLFFAVDRLVGRLVGPGGRKGLVRNLTWITIAVCTAFGFTAFFTDVSTLASRLFTGQAPLAAYLTLLILSSTTWLFAAYARERICLHMCPWPRFQAALLDRRSLVVTYQAWRGEPRGRKRVALRADLQEPGLMALAREAAAIERTVRGDCVDCTRCVTVCPTGVDIRDGLQMGCIGCGLCIDACNDVMSKIKRPSGLIRFDTESSERRRSFEPARPQWRSSKALAFAVAAIAVLSVCVFGIATMPEIEAHLEAQRNPPFVQLSDGSIRNDYALRLTHRMDHLPAVALAVEGLPGAALKRGGDAAVASEALVLKPDANRGIDDRILISLHRGEAPSGRTPFTFVLTETESGRELLRITSYFWGPENG